jgi:hypothetical protein
LTGCGLTPREAACALARHRRHFGAELAADELHTILDSLDRHGLHPERAAHALRVTQLRSLGETCAAGAPARDLTCSAVGAPSAPGELRWCSFKKRLCDCRRGGALASAAAPIFALDCEFTPLRCVVLDAAGATRLDCLVAPASREQRLLKVDRAELPLLPASEVQSALRELLAGDGLLVGHTPQRDLQALGLVGDAALPADRIVDVAALAPAVDAPPVTGGGAAARPRKRERRWRAARGEAPARLSLRALAAAHLDDGEGVRAGGGAHCAVEDAWTALRLYEALRPP